MTDSNFKTIISGCEELKQSNSDLIIAIGGGRIIDAAKLISVTALSKENYENVRADKYLDELKEKNKHTKLWWKNIEQKLSGKCKCLSVVEM